MISWHLICKYIVKFCCVHKRILKLMVEYSIQVWVDNIIYWINFQWKSVNHIMEGSIMRIWYYYYYFGITTLFIPDLSIYIFSYPTMVDGVWPINSWAKGFRPVLKAPPWQTQYRSNYFHCPLGNKPTLLGLTLLFLLNIR